MSIVLAQILAPWALQYRKDVVRFCNAAFEGMFQRSQLSLYRGNCVQEECQPALSWFNLNNLILKWSLLGYCFFQVIDLMSY